MSIKQDAQALVKAHFESNADADKCISATQLTDLIAVVTERDYSDKTIRARLRRKAYRNQSEFKNATWRITATVASSELAHYMTRNQKAS